MASAYDQEMPQSQTNPGHRTVRTQLKLSKQTTFFGEMFVEHKHPTHNGRNIESTETEQPH